MRAVVLTLDEDYTELLELIETLDASVDNIFVQKRRHPHPRLFLGKGKMEFISEYVSDNGINSVFVNGIVKPSQHYNIERKLGIECIDRIGLILRIFKKRASDLESRLQIEHATLKYEIPLLREWIHRSKTGEHPGFLAGGEYRIDIYYDLIKKRLTKIGKTLEKIRIDRKTRRKNRKKLGYSVLTMIGYTNVGKSSLFNILTKSDVFIDDKLFTTLSTRSRRISKQIRTIILIDTIGFIENMPHWLIESFQPTLEEIKESNCLLWIFDGADSNTDLIKKFRICVEILNVNEMPQIIPVMTKSDLLIDSEVEEKSNIIKNLTETSPIVVSSKTHQCIDDLITTIKERIRFPINVRIIFKSNDRVQSVISWIFDKFDSVHVSYRERPTVEFMCEDEDIKIIKSKYEDIIESITIKKKNK